jgi:hypothetical protein
MRVVCFAGVGIAWTSTTLDAGVVCFTLSVLSSCSVDNMTPPLPLPAGTLEIAPDYEPGGQEALVTGIAAAAGSVRVTLTFADGRVHEARLSAARAEQLELRLGAIVSVRSPAAEAG